MGKLSGILVLGAEEAEALELESRESLVLARRLAGKSGQKVYFLHIGGSSEELAKEAIAHGADKVLFVPADESVRTRPDFRFAVLEKLQEDLSFSVILCGSSGAETAGRLGFALSAGVFTEGVDADINEKEELVVKRYAYGGNALASYVLRRSPAILSLRPRAQPVDGPEADRKGEVETLEFQAPDSVSRKFARHLHATEQIEGVKLEEADVIVAGGRGIGGPEPFAGTLKELARLFNGVVGSSRPPADEGWVPHTCHIGLTGKIVAPQIYFAIGISGASQHMAGCSSARSIIAVNRDPEALIFNYADYGVVGDFEEVLPAFMEGARQHLQSD
jgi:electron transfer flavoprotein alpha subunit